MKTKTQDLTGPALDWAVTKCLLPEAWPDFWITIIHRGAKDYSAEWALAGPIIEREEITVSKSHVFNGWTALMHNVARRPTAVADGPTPLIAAMRCYVASVMGDEVEVPEELA